jgi:ABC-2 type transport system ATP-binding protein
MSREVIIDLQQLTVRYGSYLAVDRLDLQLYRGELFGLLGPNGAGKSSTMRVLIGQRQATSGKVSVAGFDVAREWDRVKPLFGYVPDRDNHFDEFTGRRNLKIFAGLYHVPDARVGECLRMVELEEAADQVVRGYSMGMRKKLMLARALLHDPTVLYLDEPTANLDIHSAEVVHRILRDRVKHGHSVVLTTHNMPEVEAICDRVGIMCKGKLLALDSPLTLRQAHTERKVDVILNDGERLVLSLESEGERGKLGELIRLGKVGSCHTREFDFHSTFLKLTGMEFS